MVYVTRGWVVFEYEGSGEQVLRAGSCVLQPPCIRHRELRHSDDMELIEITAPAEFTTADADAPAYPVRTRNSAAGGIPIPPRCFRGRGRRCGAGSGRSAR